jgi:tetratricopeptide (TPR) repeat protein
MDGCDVTTEPSASAPFGKLVRRVLGWFQDALDRNTQGVARLVDHDYERAIADFSAAIQRDPQFPAAYHNRGLAYFQLGRVDEALADLDAELTLAPDSVDAMGLRGNIRMQRGDLDGAIADLDAALRLAPCRADLRVSRGAARVGKGDYEQAIVDFSTVLRSSPRDASALGGRGLARFMCGENELAIADLNEAIRLNPADAFAHTNRGAALAKRGDYARAVADFDRAIRLNPAHPHACRHLAWMLATCDDPAIRDGRRAVELADKAWQLSGGKYPDWLDVLAAASAEAGDYDGAVRWQEKRVEIATPEARDVAKARLEQYRARRPFRETPAGVKPSDSSPRRRAAGVGAPGPQQ